MERSAALLLVRSQYVSLGRKCNSRSKIQSNWYVFHNHTAPSLSTWWKENGLKMSVALTSVFCPTVILNSLLKLHRRSAKLTKVISSNGVPTEQAIWACKLHGIIAKNTVYSRFKVCRETVSYNELMRRAPGKEGIIIDMSIRHDNGDDSRDVSPLKMKFF